MGNVSEAYKEVTEGELLMTNFVFNKLYLDDPYQIPRTIKLINHQNPKPMIAEGGPLTDTMQGSLGYILHNYP